MQDYDLHTFPNGIRVAHKQVAHTKVAHCGFVLDIGSRDEQPDQQGLAHFWEHMAFKGTRRRKAYHILNRLESVGGELNAYTTKEKICFYASFLDVHYAKAAELLTDITFASVFPAKELEKERSVILEEMAMYEDAPDDAIQDEFDAVVFGDHPLGYNILGTAESVRRFQREDFHRFIAQNLDTEHLVFASVGNLTLAEVLRKVGPWLSELPAMRAPRKRLPFCDYQPRQRTQRRGQQQVHCVLGGPAYALHDARRTPFFMLNNLLGGPGMNSRLNLSLREKHGLVYQVESGYTPYDDTGLFSVYFATEPGQLTRSLGLVRRELRRLREVPLGTLQLHYAKAQLMGQLAIAEERNLSLMLTLGKSVLDLGYLESLPEMFAAIEAVTAADLVAVACDVLDETRLSLLTFLPEEA